MNNEATLKRVAPLLAEKDPGEIIHIAREEFGDDLMMTTAFGYSGMVLLHYVKDVYPHIPIYFIDTTFHFEETLKLRLKIMEEWGIDIRLVRSHRSNSELIGLMGTEAFKEDPDTCCYYRKVEPLEGILKKDTVWLSATRRDQSKTRAHANVIDIDGRGHIKVNPLFDWTRDDCWNHIRKYDIPYNPLHDQSYPSIGCTHCTRPVDLGGDERSGRWIGLDKTECGLHITTPGKKN